MEAIHVWTIDGPTQLTITVHQPAVTMRCGDGPEVTMTPAQVALLTHRLNDADTYFETHDPETLI